MACFGFDLETNWETVWIIRMIPHPCVFAHVPEVLLAESLRMSNRTLSKIQRIYL